MGILLRERRAPFATTSFKKGGGGHILDGGFIFGRLGTIDEPSNNSLENAHIYKYSL